MCYEHCHMCRSCKVLYDCILPNRQCPTVNFDQDKNLCNFCREELEKFITDATFEEALDLLRKSNAKN